MKISIVIAFFLNYEGSYGQACTGSLTPAGKVKGREEALNFWKINIGCAIAHLVKNK